MGTNYYAVPKESDTVKIKIINAVIQGNYDNAIELMPKRIHIGKNSDGWKFIFNHNDWKYFNTQYSLSQFLIDNIIVDEYGRTVNSDDFWMMVNEKNKYKSHDPYCTTSFGFEFSTATNFS